MLNRNRINELLELYSNSDNIKNFKDTKQIGIPILKRDLVEAKIMIDQWNNILTDFIFHPSKKEELLEIFPNESEPESELSKAFDVIAKYTGGIFAQKFKDSTFSIWGANVHFTNDIPENIAIGVALDPNDGTLLTNDSGKLGNSIIVFSVA